MTFLRALLPAALTLALSGMGVGTALAAPEFSLKFAGPYPAGHPGDAYAKEYIAEIQQRTGDRVKITYFPAEQLGKAKDLMGTCGKGVADICQLQTTYFAGQLPYNSVVVLPYWNTAREGSMIHQYMLEHSKELQDEYLRYGTRPLAGMMTPSYQVATVSKAIRKPADLAGMKLKTAGGLFDKIARRYDISPVSIPAPETYEAVQRGVVEGLLFSYPSLRSYHLNDLVKYVTYGMRTSGFPGSIIIAEKTWRKLPEDIRKVLRDVSRVSAEREGERWDELNLKIRNEFEAQGIAIYDLSAEEQVEWARALDGLDEEYAQEMEKRGLKEVRKVLEEYKVAAARIVH